MPSERIGSFTSRLNRPVESVAPSPLIVAIHGGTYSSTYFDVPGYSLLDRAEVNGLTAIAIDRPGYGDTVPLEEARMNIAGQGAYLAEALEEVWSRFGDGHAGLFLIGHSIGAAIVATIASAPRDLPLIGIALSGIGVRTPAEHAPQWSALPETAHVEMPRPVKDHLMFGDAATFAPDMPAASHEADAPCPRPELIDIVGDWQRRASAVLSAIKVPVHYRQGEHDRLWIVDADEVARFKAMLTASPLVDGALLPRTGHCIDFHFAGRGFQLQQLGFAVQCAATLGGRRGGGRRGLTTEHGSPLDRLGADRDIDRGMLEAG